MAPRKYKVLTPEGDYLIEDITLPHLRSASSATYCAFSGIQASGDDIFEGDLVLWDGLQYRCSWDLEEARFSFFLDPELQLGMELYNLSLDIDQVRNSKRIGSVHELRR